MCLGELKCMMYVECTRQTSLREDFGRITVLNLANVRAYSNQIADYFHHVDRTVDILWVQYVIGVPKKVEYIRSLNCLPNWTINRH